VSRQFLLIFPAQKIARTFHLGYTSATLRQEGAHASLAFFLFFLFLLLPPSSDGSPSIVGSWQFKNEQIEVVAEFLPDGTFRQANMTPRGRETYTGRYQLTGQILSIPPQGAPQPQQIMGRFSDADTILATYPSGETLQWKRMKEGGTPCPSSDLSGVQGMVRFLQFCC
jgi:hypothetical protein